MSNFNIFMTKLFNFGSSWIKVFWLLKNLMKGYNTTLNVHWLMARVRKKTHLASKCINIKLVWSVKYLTVYTVYIITFNGLNLKD